MKRKTFQFGKTTVEQRIPVASDVEWPQERRARAAKQWLPFTEYVRQAMLRDPEVRARLAALTTVPIDDQLPLRMLEATSSDPSVAAFAADAAQDLVAMMQLDSVPTEFMQPDIAHAHSLETPEHIVKIGRRYNNSDEDIEQRLQEARLENGITSFEAGLARERYYWARDVKLLAVGAELTDHPFQPTEVEGTVQRMHLPSDTVIAIDSQFVQAHATLLQPHMWERRRIWKDRVHTIEVGGKKYILKERKTRFHRDTLSNGHRDGQTSEGEFRISRDLVENGTRTEGRVTVRWENALGYVQTPDGYSFVVFEFQDDLQEHRDPAATIERRILENRPLMEAEYQKTVQALEAYREHPLVLGRPKAKSGVGWYAEKLAELAGVSALSLTYKDFAAVKAHIDVSRAWAMYKAVRTERGLDNNEYYNGGTVRVIADPAQAYRVELFAYDFEYFYQREPSTNAYYQRKKEEYESVPIHDRLWNVTWDKMPPNIPPNAAARAAYFALLEQQGY